MPVRRLKQEQEHVNRETFRTILLLEVLGVLRGRPWLLFFDLVGALFNLLTAVMKFIVLLLQLAVAGVFFYFLLYFCYLLLFC